MKLFYRFCEKRGLDPGTSFVQMLETLLPVIENTAPSQLGSSKTESQTLISLVGKSQYSQASGRMKAAASQKSQITRDEVVACLAEVVTSGPVSGANLSLRDKLTHWRSNR